MAITLTYPDAFLTRHCTEDRETRAFADVDVLGAFATEWRERLTILQVYILACLENQADAEDLYTAKLKAYREEFRRQLAHAQAATPDDAGSSFIMSIPLERG
jgi:hypothetical protein